MPIVGGKIFTATLVGRRIEQVKCEKCGTSFCYELTRMGIGKESAPYNIGQTSASNRATEAAQINLSERLKNEAELVPCPKCNWVNEDMIQRYRLTRYRRDKLPIVIMIAVGLIGTPILVMNLVLALGYNSRLPQKIGLPIFVITLSSPIWILLIRRQLRLRINPNRTYPRRPVLPIATPPALVERRDPQSGQTILAPAGSEADEKSMQPGWAVYRPGQIKFPPVCCICLSTAAETFKSPMQVARGSELAVPLCKQCHAGLRRHWWVVFLVVGLIAIALGGLFALVLPYGDFFGRWFMAGFISFFVTLVGGVVTAGRVTRPYRISVVDHSRGIVKFAARNPGYTAMLIKQILASYGLDSR